MVLLGLMVGYAVSAVVMVLVGTTQPAAGPAAPVTFLALAAGLMGLAVLGRRRQLRR